MRKIPTLYVRDYTTTPPVLTDKVDPSCEWVLAGEGTATRKYDGTCVLLDPVGADVHAYTRREVKPDKALPPWFVTIGRDDETGKTVGWEPATSSGYAKYVEEALVGPPVPPGMVDAWAPGTYELIGPKVNGNPEHRDRHYLIPHSHAERVRIEEATGLAGVEQREYLRGVVLDLAGRGWEGIVWHHPDGRMAKLKARDFR